jgi:hypothetical protein
VSARAQGTVAQRLEAVEQLARETAANLKSIEAALIVMGVLPEPGRPLAPVVHLRRVK